MVCILFSTFLVFLTTQSSLCLTLTSRAANFWVHQKQKLCYKTHYNYVHFIFFIPALFNSTTPRPQGTDTCPSSLKSFISCVINILYKIQIYLIWVNTSLYDRKDILADPHLLVWRLRPGFKVIVRLGFRLRLGSVLWLERCDGRKMKVRLLRWWMCMKLILFSYGSITTTTTFPLTSVYKLSLMDSKMTAGQNI